MKDKRNDIYSGIALILFSIFMFGASYLIQPTTSDILGSRFFPRVVAVLIAVLAIVMIVSAVKALKSGDKAAEAEEKTKKQMLNMPLVLTIVGLFAYYILIMALGFTITSILYLLFQGAVLMGKEGLKNKKSLIILVIVSVVVPIALKNIFWQVFKIALPAGNLFS